MVELNLTLPAELAELLNSWVLLGVNNAANKLEGLTADEIETIKQWNLAYIQAFKERYNDP